MIHSNQTIDDHNNNIHIFYLNDSKSNNETFYQEDSLNFDYTYSFIIPGIFIVIVFLAIILIFIYYKYKRKNRRVSISTTKNYEFSVFNDTNDFTNLQDKNVIDNLKRRSCSDSCPKYESEVHYTLKGKKEVKKSTFYSEVVEEKSSDEDMN